MDLNKLMETIPNSVIPPGVIASKRRRRSKSGEGMDDDEANRLFQKAVRYGLARNSVGFCKECDGWYDMEAIVQLYCPVHGCMLSDRHYKKPKARQSYRARRQDTQRTDSPRPKADPSIKQADFDYDKVECDKFKRVTVIKGGHGPDLKLTYTCTFDGGGRCALTAAGRTLHCPRVAAKKGSVVKETKKVAKTKKSKPKKK